MTDTQTGRARENGEAAVVQEQRRQQRLVAICLETECNQTGSGRPRVNKMDGWMDAALGWGGAKTSVSLVRPSNSAGLVWPCSRALSLSLPLQASVSGAPGSSEGR
jgi:hypothetical protein